VIIVVLIRFTLLSDQEELLGRKYPCLLASISESLPEFRSQGFPGISICSDWPEV